MYDQTNNISEANGNAKLLIIKRITQLIQRK